MHFQFLLFFLLRIPPFSFAASPQLKRILLCAVRAVTQLDMHSNYNAAHLTTRVERARDNCWCNRPSVYRSRNSLIVSRVRLFRHSPFQRVHMVVSENEKSSSGLSLSFPVSPTLFTRSSPPPEVSSGDAAACHMSLTDGIHRRHSRCVRPDAPHSMGVTSSLHYPLNTAFAFLSLAFLLCLERTFTLTRLVPCCIIT